MISRVVMFPKRLKESKPKQGFVEYETFQLLISKAGELWLKLFVQVAFTYGWRKSDILGSRVRNVDRAGNRLRIETSKNGEAREVALTPEISMLLAVAC